jgi:hypothetical protein
MPEPLAAVADVSTDPGAAATITELPGKVGNRARRGSAAAAVSAPQKPRRVPGCPLSRRSWRAVLRRPLAPGNGIWLEPAGPVPGTVPCGRAAGPLLAVAVTALAAAQYATGRPIAVAWLAIAPLLASLALRPLRTTLLAGWTVLLGLGLVLDRPGPVGRLASSLAVLALLAAFAVANSVLRCEAQRRLGQVRAVARVAQSALLREVPRSVAAVLAGLLATGPFPVDMIGSGERIGNTTPPSIALLAFAAAQTGLVLAAEPFV